MKAKILAAVLSTIMLALGSGCAVVVVGAAAGGVGAVVYGNGELRAREYVAYDQGWDSTLAAMNDLGYAVVGREKDLVEGKITTRAPDDKKVQVRVTKVSGTITEFGIRVGSFGDKAKSQPILDAIKKRL